MAFWRNLSSPENVAKRDWSKRAGASHEALLHCYTSRTDTSAAILGGLADVTRPEPFRCPYCLMRQPKTWDHFLAKEDFPEFATLAPNLVRACSTCNHKKLRHWTDAPRRVINPYHDPIPTDALLWCDVTVSQQNRLKLTYYIFRDPQVPDATLDLFERHFEAFELQSDMKAEGATAASSFIKEIIALRNAPLSAEELDEKIVAKLTGFEEFPANSWEIATFEGLRDCNGLLDFVNALVTPYQEPPPRLKRSEIKAKLMPKS